MKTTPIKYVAQLSHVREASLLGSADLAFWQERLRDEGLEPAPRNGQAQLLLIAAEGRFMGLTFRELSFSVLVWHQEPSAQGEVAFLAQAFNSRRFFAFCERTFFSTPYDYGDVRVTATDTARIELVANGESVFCVQMNAKPEATRKSIFEGDDGWEGPVFLPKSGANNTRQRRLFFAKVRGHTRKFAFLPAHDALTFCPTPSSDILRALAESRFTPTEWSIRDDAFHAKSKTYSRNEEFLGMSLGIPVHR